MKKQVTIIAALAAAVFVSAEAVAATSCPIKLGFVRADSGSGASFGQSLTRGLNMALDEINAAGGVLGCKVELISYDTQSVPANAATLARRLISQDRVPLIIGSSPSPEVLAAMEITENAGVPLYIPSAAAGKITGQGYKWIWRQSVIDASAARAMAEYLVTDRKWKKVGAIYENTDYGKPVVLNVLKPALEQRGASLVAAEAFNPGDSDLSGPLLRMKAAGVDGVVYWGHEKEAAIMAKQNLQLKTNFAFAANTGVVLSTFIDLLSADVQGATKLVAISQSVWTTDVPKQVVWIKKFKQRYNKEPDATSMDGYDAGFFLKEALQKAGDISKPENIQKALRTVKYDGIGGPISYDETGQASRALLISELTPKNQAGFKVVKHITASPR
jgi:branched-chain amino acid transport system substrate-binding protein